MLKVNLTLTPLPPSVWIPYPLVMEFQTHCHCSSHQISPSVLKFSSEQSLAVTPVKLHPPLWVIFLHNGSLQYQCVFAGIESIFSSHTVCASRKDICYRLILFRWFHIGYTDFNQHLLAFLSPNEVLFSALLFFVGTIFTTAALFVLAFYHSLFLCTVSSY